MPGLPEEVLFNSDEVSGAREAQEMTDSDEEEDEAFAELLEEDGLCENLSLEESQKEGNVVTFQVAATHDIWAISCRMAAMFEFVFAILVDLSILLLPRFGERGKFF